jgi:hypothetical protein
MTSNDPQHNAPVGERDDLRAIQGIGPKFADALYSIGIRRYGQLAHYTPAALVQALSEQTGLKVSPQRIETQDWLGQARLLAGRAGPEAIPSQPGTAPEELAWRQHAGFSLFFDYMLNEQGERTWQTRVWQTRIYHDESGEEALFPGVTPDPWVAWILEQAKLRLVADPEAETPLPADPQARYGILERILGAPASETPLAGAPLQIEVLALEVEQQAKALAISLRFGLSGSRVGALTSAQAAYQVEIHLLDLADDTSHLVSSERGRLQPEKLEYASQQQFPIPEPGRFALQSLVLLLPPGETLLLHTGPTIRVVP